MNKEYETPSVLIVPINEMDIITSSPDFDDIRDYPTEWE